MDMKDIEKRFKEMDLPESEKRFRLNKYSDLTRKGYSPNEIFNKIKGLTVEEAYIYYHMQKQNH